MNDATDSATSRATTNRAMIDVDALTVRFRTTTGTFDAVRDARFQVHAGEAFGLVGESGSGKSTVLRALTGLVPVAGGRLTVGGYAVGAQRDAEHGVARDARGASGKRDRSLQ